ncbi:MAG: phosphonate C-P lyase system protein PhnL [Aestuariivirga sp.]|uniref:phosphonate C-P lyase system protein PhnL n=1 Tax=Aestuariivirga sp. TaxID=2650926 RepID=UPI0025C46756|nr:phosphonate C-P lyase system protein PhnL [Aestuariivirga sp.]MCA3560313.1 phosphonate C-P lyase system protein PhnL [Aestuariivirga sp.]
MSTVLKIENLSKSFLLHQQAGARIQVFEGLTAEVKAGEAVAVTGPSGRGKSSLLKLVYGVYRASAGSIRVLSDGAWTDVVTAPPRGVIGLRRDVIGYVTQFLRVIPRVPAEMVVAEPMIDRGIAPEQALARARMLLERLNIPKRLWHLSPMTFSGGEQQRVNIARGFAAHFPILLLDEPTASLDEDNRNRVLELVAGAREEGSAILAVFHDEQERRRACSRSIALG